MKRFAGEQAEIFRIFSNEKESTRAIAVMHYVDKMKLETIASEIGLSLSGVKKRLKKLKDNLKPVKGMYLE